MYGTIRMNFELHTVKDEYYLRCSSEINPQFPPSSELFPVAKIVRHLIGGITRRQRVSVCCILIHFTMIKMKLKQMEKNFKYTASKSPLENVKTTETTSAKISRKISSAFERGCQNIYLLFAVCACYDFIFLVKSSY